MIKIVLCGAAGRMGKEIINIVQSLDNIKIVAGIEIKGHRSVGGKISGIQIGDDLLASIDDADCVIDFTNHKATVDYLKKVKDYKKPYVTGTTGFTDEEHEQIKSLSKIFPIFLAPNMSKGVNHLYNLVGSSAGVLSDYDIEIIETHHKDKKDAPSGTAKAIAQIIKSERPDVHFVYGRQGMIGARASEEVCINSVRGGDVVGEHRILFLGDGEFVELRHYATSRRCFASGAIAAVMYIVNKPAGLYGMQDLLTQIASQ